MPIMNCQSGGKPGFKYGQSGKCYPYKEGNEASKKKARNKARKQGIAEIVNNFEMNINKKSE